MFDDNELEQIREERDDWQGHVDRQTVKRSKTSGKIFFGSVGASVVMAVFLAFITISGAMATGTLVGLAGVGGFFAQIESIENAENIAIYPALGPTAACESEVDFNEGPSELDEGVALPQLRAEIGGLDIPDGQALTLTKDINLPDSFLTDLQTFRVEVTQEADEGEVNINDAVLYLTALEADQIEINEAQIREFFSDSPGDSFYEGGAGLAVTDDDVEGANTRPGEFAIQNRPGTTADASIEGAAARAHFVAFDQLDIENIKLETAYGTSEEELEDVVSIDHQAECPDDLLPDGEGDDDPTGSD